MKKLLLPFLLFISSFQLFSQGSFQKTYDLGDDYGNNVVLGNNAIYVCGSTNKLGAGSYDAFLMKFDTAGNVKWQTQFGGSNFEVGRSLTMFPDGSGVLVTGSTASLSVSHKNDIAVSLVDSGGTYQGSLYFGFDSLSENANDITISPVDSGFLITGQTEANGDGSHTNMFVIKTTREANPLWMKTYGTPTSNEVGLKIFDLPMIGIIAIGSSEAPGVAGQSDAFIAHIDEADGTLKDGILIGTGGHDDGRFFLFNNNQIIVGGMTGSMSGPNRNDIFITALDPANNLATVWSKVYGGDSATALQSLTVDPVDGHLVVGGYSNSYGTGQSGILFKVDSANGNVIWANMIDGPADDFVQGGTVAPDGTSIICGFSNSGSVNNNVYLARTSTTGGLCNNVSAIAMTALNYTYSFVGPSIPGIRDSTVAFPAQQTMLTANSYTAVVNDLCGSTGVRTLSSKDNTIHVYPNPTSGKLFIESSNGWSSKAIMSVYNILGSEVLVKTIEPKTKDFTIDLSGSPKGMYIISFNDGKTITTEKISLN